MNFNQILMIDIQPILLQIFNTFRFNPLRHDMYNVHTFSLGSMVNFIAFQCICAQFLFFFSINVARLKYCCYHKINKLSRKMDTIIANE